MKSSVFNIIFAGALIAFGTISSISAAPVVRSGSGANAAAIQAVVDQFRADLGALNPNNGQVFTGGRREVNWDGVPDNLASPNNMPPDFFNINSRRGIVFTTACSDAAFRVSSNAASGVPVRFGEIDPSYTNTFQTFSNQKLFTVISDSAVPCNILTSNFFIPGTQTPATVSGFGAVFADVEAAGDARILCYDKGGKLLAPGALTATPANGGLSFIGVSFTEGERISQCQIISGPSRLVQGNVDGVNGVNVVAMDDFIYGEPRAAEYHGADFDGDGTSDFSVFRPETGQWFFVNSGTSTFTFSTFGQNGDIPIDGDFDGDSRADLAVFRPSNGTWFRLLSATPSFITRQFGEPGDKPVAADYDRDGKTDIAVWRPTTGTFFFTGSRNESFNVFNFGVNGDIPILGAAY